MARFLTTTDSIARTEAVIKQSQRRLILISPYVQISERYMRRLSDADNRGVQIDLVCRVEDLKADQRSLLTNLDNLTLYDDPRLHAKCFACEKGLVLTSLNFYEASEANYEMGIYLDVEDDEVLYREAMNEARHIIEHATEVTLDRPKSSTSKKAASGHRSRKMKQSSSKLPTSGHCLRCGASIDYDPSAPYCPEHYYEWKEYENWSYKDDFCHSCGTKRRRSVSREKPECTECFKVNKALRQTSLV